jgi:hypothetical protein
MHLRWISNFREWSGYIMWSFPKTDGFIMAIQQYFLATMSVIHSITLPSIFFSAELLYNLDTGLRHVESLVNLTVLLFGMLCTAGLGRHVA